MEDHYNHKEKWTTQKPGGRSSMKKDLGTAGAAGVNDTDDIPRLFQKTIAEFMENGLDSMLGEHLGYDRYDTKEKAMDDSRNDHSSKTLRTCFDDTTIQIPEIGKVNSIRYS